MKQILLYAIAMVFVISVFVYFKQIVPKRVLTETEKWVHFQELKKSKLVFVSRDGKRPWIVVCGNKVDTKWGWKKYK